MRRTRATECELPLLLREAIEDGRWTKRGKNGSMVDSVGRLYGIEHPQEAIRLLDRDGMFGAILAWSKPYFPGQFAGAPLLGMVLPPEPNILVTLPLVDLRRFYPLATLNTGPFLGLDYRLGKEPSVVEAKPVGRYSFHWTVAYRSIREFFLALDGDSR